MNITIAKTAGFCFGVDRAVSSVYESIKKYKMPIYTLGPIIHNKEVVGDLESKGVNVVEDLDHLGSDDGVVIIRSHGVPPEVYNKIKDNNILSIDMTCPYVKKIHKIAKDHKEKGYQLIIVGDPTHPEVIGINGWCDNQAVIVNSLEECYDLEKFDKICIVVQTTYSVDKWEKIKNFLILNKCNEYVIFDTICNTTNERQKEASEIAKNVEAMIVVGGKHSSNTQKLYNICKQNCVNTFYVETLEDLNLTEMKRFVNVGITAGASTPTWVINEIVDRLNNLENAQPEQDVVEPDAEEEHHIQAPSDTVEKTPPEDYQSFEDALEQSLKPIKPGTIVSGNVLSITDEAIFVDLGYKADGIIPLEELQEDGRALHDIRVGDKIEAMVIKNNDGEGNVLLSKNAVDKEKSWEKASKAYETESVILVKVSNDVKGGVQGYFESLKVFIPISQLSDKFVKDAGEFINTTIPVRIIEFDEERQNIVASSRVVLEESKEKSKNNFWDGVHIGKDFLGKVKKLAAYGAFVDIGGVDGLLHISEITWNKNDNPEKYLNIDDEVEVYVKEFDKHLNKIMLGLKNKPESPWTKISGKYSEGDIVDGTVVRLVTFGAFIELEPGIDGLVHISQISDKRITKPEEILQVGEKVKAKIVSIDPTNKRIGLSIKDVAPINAKGQTNLEYEDSHNHVETMNATIGDLFNLKDKFSK